MKLDLNGDGTLDRKELQQLCLLMMKVNPEEITTMKKQQRKDLGVTDYVLTVPKYADTDHDGKISLEELKAAAHPIDHPLEFLKDPPSQKPGQDQKV